ncbi:hypothetical protein MLD38_036233 [Melastoma candidum]|uniref:Uncharacterized protein n=1 Tax=Melastoma candidum TaxID=119954 RepID=A0ACB9LJR3_9MYRT|nr:hypothetical protein MLD38_036233 [Melastoma candidum]
MSFHARRILPPGLSKKRKEGEAFYNPGPLPIKRSTTSPSPSPSPRASHPFVEPTPPSYVPPAAAQAKGRKPPDSPAIDNRILAGYMAHEFLTRGTILGQRFDPARAEAVAVSGAEPRKRPGVAERSESPRKGKGKEKEEEEDDKAKTTTQQQRKKKHPSYADVASMLKVEGAHIPGVVNPSQLVKWLHR